MALSGLLNVTACGSWTTATRTARRLRCAATACASSSITCVARASWICRLDRRETIDVRVPGIDGVLGGIWVDMPNPHTVVELADEETLREVFLPTVDVSQIPQAQRPSYDPAPQAGTNLELVVDLTEPGGERGHIVMRVLERGVGETQACGTGCCAAALATALRRGPGAPTQWVVDIPGGTVIVGLDGVIDWSGEHPRITDASVFLTGPATRVAEIRLP